MGRYSSATLSIESSSSGEGEPSKNSSTAEGRRAADIVAVGAGVMAADRERVKGLADDARETDAETARVPRPREEDVEAVAEVDVDPVRLRRRGKRGTSATVGLGPGEGGRRDMSVRGCRASCAQVQVVDHNLEEGLCSVICRVGRGGVEVRREDDNRGERKGLIARQPPACVTNPRSKRGPNPRALF